MAGDTALLDQYNGGSLVITAVVLLVLTWISVMLRTYVRAFMTNSFQMDDWLMLVAQTNFTLSCVFILLGVTVGLGHHNKALPQWEEILALKWQALATATYIANMMLIKLSLGVFLLRLATQNRYKWIIWVSMGVVSIWSTALFFWDIFQCTPVKAQWDYTIPGYKCVSAREVVNAAYALSVLNIVTDWLYALLPVPMIWNAKMTMQAKITVGLVLGLGIFASVATLIRVKFLSDLTDTSDILYVGTDAMVWTLVEPGVAIVASSLVTIRPLLRQWRLKGFESSQRSRSNGLWARYGRSGGRGGGGNVSEIGRGNDTNGKYHHHHHHHEKLDSKTTRAGGWVPGMGADDVGLSDLEASYSRTGARSVRSASASKGKGAGGGGVWSRDATLTSRTSAHDNISSSNNNNNEAYSGMGRGGGWGGSVREEMEIDGGGAAEGHRSYQHREEEEQEGDYDDDAITPVSPWPVVGAPAASSGSDDDESAFVIDGAAGMMRGHLQGGKPVWRTTTTTGGGPGPYVPRAGAETPNSPEESERIQGLRQPGPRRDGTETFPFS